MQFNLFIWSGNIILSGDLSILENGGHIDNIANIKSLGISELMDNNTNNDQAKLIQIIQTFSGEGLQDIASIQKILENFSSINIDPNINTTICNPGYTINGKNCIQNVWGT